ncbi:hypothetical protein ROSA5918_04910 [Roseateles saccharophilus]|uniref:Uncharacterized protein n=2 Tax=Roseateles saccharophilus TaxID=304 RepID=A0A4R3VEU0_ROSSA|nr:hypothetical protein EV671_1002178 [Roseateles saccharophilus]
MLALAAGMAAGMAAAQEPQKPWEPVAVRVVRFEKLGGGVERPTGEPVVREMQPMPERLYAVKDGVYRSALSRIALRVPRIGEEKLVDVREAIAIIRADGTPSTTQIMFDPGGTLAVSASTDPLSAVVVTRLRDDRPKDAERVLAGIDGGEVQRANLSARGVGYHRVQTQMGPGLARVIRNRVRTLRFPYDIGLLNDSGTVTYGVTAFVVVGRDSMVEFSQLFPCGQRSDGDCRVAALKAHEAFINGVTGFTDYAAVGYKPASSAH